MRKTVTHRERKKRILRHHLMVVMLAVSVAISTLLALATPAIAMETEPVCGRTEHVHNNECYGMVKICMYGEESDCVGDTVQICGQDDSDGDHVHTDECFHIHTEECFRHMALGKICQYGSDDDSIGDVVIACLLTEGENGHQHTDECYHIHTSECFMDTPICGIEEHVHDSSCYDLQAGISNAETEDLPENGITKKEQEMMSLSNEMTEEELPEEEETLLMPMMLAPMMAASSGNALSVDGVVSVDGNAPGNGNSFTFGITSADGATVYLTAQNNADGNITFDASSLSNGTYVVKQIPTDSERQSHINMIFDNSEKTVSISGQKSSTGYNWLINGYLYFVTGGASGGPIRVWKSDGTESVFAYCLNNSRTEPDNFWNSKAQYKAIIPVTSLSEYAQNSNASLEKIKKVIYHYTANPPQSESEWDNVEIIISHLASGTTINSIQNNMLNTCLKETVPDNFTLVLLTPYGNNRSSYSTTSKGGYDSYLQNLITGYIVGDRRADYDSIMFANTTASTEPDIRQKCEISVKADKTLDGKVPGEDYVFEFQLSDAEGNILQTRQNDAEGSIVFDALSFDEKGTYAYFVSEVNDGQKGIEYDPGIHKVTVNVTETEYGTPTDFDFSAGTYYGLASDDQDDAKTYYLSKNKGGTDLIAYCIDASKDFPPLANDLTTGYDLTKYSVIQEPSNSTLENYVGQIKDSGNTLSNLKKLLYYIDQHPELTQQKRNALVWSATSAADEFYTSVSQSELAEIYASTTVPADYHLALFYPSQLGGSRASSVTLDRYQPLLTGYYTDDPVLDATVTYTDGNIVFRNTTATNAGYELPETGGYGTPLLHLFGLIITGMAAVMYIYFPFVRDGRFIKK